MLKLFDELVKLIDEAAEQKDFEQISNDAFNNDILQAEKKLDAIIADKVSKSNQAELIETINNLVCAYRYSYYKAGFKDGIKSIIEKAL